MASLISFFPSFPYFSSFTSAATSSLASFFAEAEAPTSRPQMWCIAPEALTCAAMNRRLKFPAISVGSSDLRECRGAASAGEEGAEGRIGDEKKRSIDPERSVQYGRGYAAAAGTARSADIVRYCEMFGRGRCGRGKKRHERIGDEQPWGAARRARGCAVRRRSPWVVRRVARYRPDREASRSRSSLCWVARGASRPRRGHRRIEGRDVREEGYEGLIGDQRFRRTRVRRAASVESSESRERGKCPRTRRKQDRIGDVKPDPLRPRCCSYYEGMGGVGYFQNSVTICLQHTLRAVPLLLVDFKPFPPSTTPPPSSPRTAQDIATSTSPSSPTSPSGTATNTWSLSYGGELTTGTKIWFKTSFPVDVVPQAGDKSVILQGVASRFLECVWDDAEGSARVNFSRPDQPLCGLGMQ
ncbi:hypothetical protein K438DRAFT_1765255 [Mycena galopus ATCC 62051]|nr:hypothetical protein K438DRAFT_1765255 [Mycena galopus ATCC 62051]